MTEQEILQKAIKKATNNGYVFDEDLPHGPFQIPTT